MIVAAVVILLLAAVVLALGIREVRRAPDLREGREFREFRDWREEFGDVWGPGVHQSVPVRERDDAP